VMTKVRRLARGHELRPRSFYEGITKETRLRTQAQLTNARSRTMQGRGVDLRRSTMGVDFTCFSSLAGRVRVLKLSLF